LLRTRNPQHSSLIALKSIFETQNYTTSRTDLLRLMTWEGGKIQMLDNMS